MELFLFTNFFPFKRSEPFLVNEFPFTVKSFKSISILSLYGKEEECILEKTGSVEVFRPVFSAANAKSEILFKGLFNSASISFHLNDFLKNSVLFSPKKLYWFLISFCITRATLSSRSLKKMIARIEASEKPVLYFYWGDNLTWIIPYLKKKIKNKNIKIVIRLHGSDLYENLKGDYAPLRKQIFSIADRLYTVSSFGKKYLDELYPQFTSKIKVARLGVKDHGETSIKTEDTFKILSISNLVPLKRVPLIFEALQLLKFPVEWHHYGDGPLGEELRALVKTAAPNIKIVIHGFVKNEDLIKDLQSNYFDVFVNVSSSEGLPVSIMEAFSFGIPAIATNVGGTSELVDEKTGTLVDLNSKVKDISREIEFFFRQENNLVSTKRVNARKRFELLANAEKNYVEFYSMLKTLINE